MSFQLLFVGILAGYVHGAPFREGFAFPQGSSSLSLMEGDMVVSGAEPGAELSLDAFISKMTALWPQGMVPFHIETFEWQGTNLPIFTDPQIGNITQALGQIMQEVPCIKFR